MALRQGPLDVQPREVIRVAKGLSIDWCIGSKIAAISPTVDRLMRVIKESQISFEDGVGVELAIREALANAIVHGNRQDLNRQSSYPVSVPVAWGSLLSQ